MSNRGFGILLVIMLGALLAALAASGCTPARREARDGAGSALADTVTRTATVADVLDGRVAVGASVRVAGRCVGYSAGLSPDGPPITRSDWLLEADGRRVFVTGAYPPGCSALTPSEAPVTVIAVVAEDTLANLGGGAPRVRRYLVRRQ